MKLVLDASVALKWFFRERRGETHADAAIDILHGHAQRRHLLIEPPHFLAEMCAVLARESPQTMAQDLRDLLDLGLPMEADPAVYEIAMQLSRELGHHLFDTLYHALALHTEGALLVTADTTYARKAGHLGRLLPLQDWAPGAGQPAAGP